MSGDSRIIGILRTLAGKDKSIKKHQSVIEPSTMSSDTASEIANQIEIGRVQTWLSGAIDLIQTNSKSIDDPTRLEKRNKIVQLLRQYKDNAVFPQQQSRYRMPCFIDSSQRPCALADLLQRTGSGELAQRIAFEDNSAIVADMPSSLTVDTWADIVAWLSLVAALSVPEAMRVQPTYGRGPLTEFVEDEEHERNMAELRAHVIKLSRAKTEARQKQKCCACALL